jgi:hypothetical protein
MDTSDLLLDGNAVAGALGRAFAFDTTVARSTCDACGAAGPLGGAHVYAHAPGAVIRCASCEAVLMVVVERNGGFVLGFERLRSVELR